MNQQINIEYTTRRCSKCGTYYAVETGRDFMRGCPRCLGNENNDKDIQNKIFVRSIRALKSYIRRMKTK